MIHWFTRAYLGHCQISMIGGLCHIEISPLICSANQWTAFYMIGTFVMKELTIFKKSFIMDVRQSSKYASGLLKDDQCWRNFVVNIVFLLWIFECCAYTVSSSWKTWSPIYYYLTPKNRFLAAPHLTLNQMKLICKYTWLFVMSFKCLQNCAPSRLYRHQ